VLNLRLHSNPMDMDRPLWEVHLIEGLHGGRFAMYGKMHHSLADGVSGVGLVNFPEDPTQTRTPPIWAQSASRSHAGRPPSGVMGVLPSALLGQAQALPSLLRGLAGSAKAAIASRRPGLRLAGGSGRARSSTPTSRRSAASRRRPRASRA